MVRSFAITTATSSLRLDGAGKGESTFTITNAVGRPVRARVLLEPEGVARQEWLSLVGDAERDFAPDGTHQYLVRVAVPPGTPEGSYAFHLSAVSTDNPDEEFSIGPSVGFQVSRPAPVERKKRSPLGWIALAAGLLLITLVAVLVFRSRGDEGVGGSGVAEGSGAAGQEAAREVFLSFDGKESFVELGDPRELAFTGLITVEAWIRPRTLSGLRNIVAHGYTFSPNTEFFFRINQGQYQVGSWNGQSFFTSAAAPDTDAGRWVHLAGVYDGSRWILYRDGEQVAATPQTTGVLRVDAPWAIGARGGGSNRFFLGDIRDVRIWNIPRNQQEIRADMNRTLRGDEQGLVANWPLNEGQGELVREISPRANHGLVRHGTWGELRAGSPSSP
jgi:hypothetical protein